VATREERVQGSGKVILYGSPYCGLVPRARRLLDQAGAEYEYVDITRSADTRARLREINRGHESVPTLAFPDGSTLTEPSTGELSAKLEELGYEVDRPSFGDRLRRAVGS
jgi:mycoredoxin